eukprot:jgi/Psemu1/31303/gm1.31303_g
MAPSTSGSKRGPKPASNDATQRTKKTRKTHHQSESTPRCISQDTDEETPTQAETSNLKPALAYSLAIRSTVQDDVDHQKHRTSIEKNLQLALNGQTYASAEFVKALSFKFATYFTQLMTKVFIVSKIIQSEPRPDFTKKLSTKSLTKKKGKKKTEEKENNRRDGQFFLYKEVDNGVTGVLGLLEKKEISNGLKDYDMKNKWDNFESLLRNVHGETVGGDTNNSLYEHNVVNYITMKKYLTMYWEILLWYMENVEYPLSPNNLDQSLCFYTKGEEGRPHESGNYVTAMKEFLDDLLAKLSL